MRLHNTPCTVPAQEYAGKNARARRSYFRLCSIGGCGYRRHGSRARRLFARKAPGIRLIRIRYTDTATSCDVSISSNNAARRLALSAYLLLFSERSRAREPCPQPHGPPHYYHPFSGKSRTHHVRASRACRHNRALAREGRDALAVRRLYCSRRLTPPERAPFRQTKQIDERGTLSSCMQHHRRPHNSQNKKPHTHGVREKESARNKNKGNSTLRNIGHHACQQRSCSALSASLVPPDSVPLSPTAPWRPAIEPPARPNSTHFFMYVPDMT